MACVLIIGGGGREHAIAWKLSQSSSVANIYVAPGNGGTAKEKKCSNISLNVRDNQSVATWCIDNNIGLVVVGPEDPLASGIADDLQAKGILCFGPTALAARLESSKAFAKSFMNKNGIPTARWKSFTNFDEACDFIMNADFPALVVKANGLAAGKGVVVATTREEACQAARDMLLNDMHGSAGKEIVVEEYLAGPEISCLAFSDGTTVALMPPAQDHKRLMDGDLGPNTGGMGAYCPCDLITEAELEIVKRDIIQKTVDSMREQGTPFIGVLYAGLMLTASGPKVLEFNCRFGDPETQVILPLLKNDLYDVITKCVTSTLANISVEFESKQHTIGVVTAINGYPVAYKKGVEITGVKQAANEMKLDVFHSGTTITDEDKLVTNGGRILTIVSRHAQLAQAAQQALWGALLVQYEGKIFRRDIGHSAIKRTNRLTYETCGVSIKSGDNFVERIKPLAALTQRPGCKGDLGMFGGVFDVRAAGYQDPLLVSGTDGVGTKLKIAQACGIHNTVGIDLVAMCVNDIICHGAEPLFFLDYFACSKLDVNVASNVIEGITHGCQLAGCNLLGGETAEMPGMYLSDEYDLAGFAVGAVERDFYLPLVENIVPGDVIIGLPSSGIHSNGYSLVRRLVENYGFTYDMTCPWDNTKTLGNALLTPTKIYSRTLLPVLWLRKVKAAAHITGGGLPGNVSRVIPSNARVVLDANRWKIPEVFGWIADKGNVEASEMATTFNCGIGMVLIVSEGDKDAVLQQLRAAGEQAVIVGDVQPAANGKPTIEVVNLSTVLTNMASKLGGKHKADGDLSDAFDKKLRVAPSQLNRKKVGVLISGSGTNLQALINYTQNMNNSSNAEIVLVISNIPEVQGLKRAEAAGIPYKVINHKLFASREEFDKAVDAELSAAGVEIVCLAGFMRIISEWFVNKWRGSLLNIHPSLLPSFKGVHAHKLVLEAGVRVSGCTVHFVAEEVDAGAIIVQETVPVYPTDTEEILQERVKTVEHKAYPRALELLASGKVSLSEKGRIIWQ